MHMLPVLLWTLDLGWLASRLIIGGHQQLTEERSHHRGMEKAVAALRPPPPRSLCWPVPKFQRHWCEMLNVTLYLKYISN
jgi:hypothetical protein